MNAKLHFLAVMSFVLLNVTEVTEADERTAVSSADVDFSRDVFSVLRRSCFECHGPEKQEGELRLDSAAAIAESGTIEPGRPDESELLRRLLLPRGHEELMPAVGDPLPGKEVAALRRWIQNGALWPADFEVPPHWAYVAPSLPDVPEPVKTAGALNGWGRNEVDRFVAQRLQEEGLHPSPDADPETMIRRVFFDTIGLPPTLAEVDRYLQDPSDAAYERLVDDLLSRPQFGEKWARHWLDLARYADSHGFQRDDLRDVWAYRDWVIRAMNQDMPFDRFTIEQLAGDLLPDATEEQRIATGFHRCTPTNVEAGSIPEETRVEQVLDRVNTTGAVWLGTTMECAQCHDHKYDPFTRQDYYRLLAYFNHTELEADRKDPKQPSSIAFQGPSMPLSNPEREAQRAELTAKAQQIETQIAQHRQQLDKDLDTWATELARRLKSAPVTQTMAVREFSSLGTTDTHRILEDGSVLLVGSDPPDTDTYDVSLTCGVDQLSALRLDVLTHESLPGMGPGRGDSKRTNFVLHRLKAFLTTPDGTTSELKFSSARADFSQSNWSVEGILNDAPKTGWAISPQFSKPHWALLILEQPRDVDPSSTIRVTMEQNFGGARTIGCFRLSAVSGNPDDKPLPAALVKILNKVPEKWSPKDRRQLLDYRAESDAEAMRLNRERQRLEKQKEGIANDTTLVMIEMDTPRENYMFVRGDYRTKGDTVSPGTPAALHSPLEGPPNRLTLARWLADARNPLIARVTVNRWWAELFGRGIVATVEDFGTKGDPPTHPELLDWLSVRFTTDGWSMKKTLKTILLSSTYRQSSVIDPHDKDVDDQNRWLSRGPAFRMDAEMIRDNVLAISGQLSLKQFGPPIRPWQPDGTWTKVGGQNYDYQVSPGDEQYRRGIYVVLKRGAPYPSFINFDASARLACTVKRSRTNTPLQALTLLNDPVYVEAAKAFAVRVLTEAADQPQPQQLTYAFRLVTARTPRPSELSVLENLLESQRSELRENPEQVKVFLGDFKQPKKVDAQELASWFSVTSTLLNLHETITRN